MGVDHDSPYQNLAGCDCHIHRHGVPTQILALAAALHSKADLQHIHCSVDLAIRGHQHIITTLGSQHMQTLALHNICLYKLMWLNYGVGSL